MGGAEPIRTASANRARYWWNEEISPRLAALNMPSSVLMVEDSSVLARPLKRFLKHLGYTVHHASSCSEARACAGPFDVGLFDIELSDGSGIGLCLELLASKVVAAAVFYTAVVHPTSLEQAAGLGRVVRKTQSAEDLREAICAALREVAAARANGHSTERQCS
jgi:DNA-binding response OmpR family regulator